MSKFFIISSALVKLPDDFNGTIGDVFIKIGERFNESDYSKESEYTYIPDEIINTIKENNEEFSYGNIAKYLDEHDVDSFCGSVVLTQLENGDFVDINLNNKNEE